MIWAIDYLDEAGGSVALGVLQVMCRWALSNDYEGEELGQCLRIGLLAASQLTLADAQMELGLANQATAFVGPTFPAPESPSECDKEEVLQAVEAEEQERDQPNAKLHVCEKFKLATGGALLDETDQIDP